MSNYGLKISKTGYDVNTALPKNLALSSQFDTLKVVRSGTLTINLPSETIVSNTTVRTTSYSHNLGYIPLFIPLIKRVIYAGDLATGGSYTVNDIAEIDIPPGPYGPSIGGELIDLYVTSTSLTLSITRYSPLGSQIYGARTATLYYTLFHNQVDSAFNLL